MHTTLLKNRCDWWNFLIKRIRNEPISIRAFSSLGEGSCERIGWDVRIAVIQYHGSFQIQTQKERVDLRWGMRVRTACHGSGTHAKKYAGADRLVPVVCKG